MIKKSIFAFLFFALMHHSGIALPLANQQQLRMENHPKNNLKDNGDWEIFWEFFQNAIVQRQSQEIRELANPNTIDADAIENILLFFSEESSVNQLRQLSILDFEANDGMDEVENAENVHKLSVFISFVVDGEVEGESAVIFYFGEVDGNIQLINVMFAG